MTWIKGEKQLLNLQSNFFLPLAFQCFSIPPLIRCLSLPRSIFYLQGTSHQSFPCPSIFSAHLFLFWPQFSLIQGFIFLCLSTARSPLSCQSPSLSQQIHNHSCSRCLPSPPGEGSNSLTLLPPPHTAATDKVQSFSLCNHFLPMLIWYFSNTLKLTQ